MKKSTIRKIVENYDYFKESKITGRYLPHKIISPLVHKLPTKFNWSVLGNSYKGVPIYTIKIGSGKTKILIWSQMHGNESTGTKAIFDIFKFFKKPLTSKIYCDHLLNNITFLFVPMLNPDGAKVYNRLNAQNIDLNRDAVALKAPESLLLNKVLHQFKPDYCFNLHDQRTIFSVGKQNKPATLSFLAPSTNKSRSLTKGRKQTMQVIANIYKNLKKILPNQIGRYTDEFYPTATGDNFQKAGFNTILIEAGHYKDDYQREITRKYNFLALLMGFGAIVNSNNINYQIYFKIPNNKKNYLDICYKNVVINGKNCAVGVQFKETLVNNTILFLPEFSVLSKKNMNANKIVKKIYIVNDLADFKAITTNI